jgi:phosphoribosylaminoimidazolecarboxamide formyltransferase/IMP cyclohydrolase
MVRAAATNFKQVLVVTNPEMYGEVANALDKGEIAMSLRKELALSAFEYCREYDLEIIQFLQSFP